ncbi:MAG TPA: protein kinase [Planctomycetia bacterium]|nr:protein kinase [Planctomycetia bacterium]
MNSALVETLRCANCGAENSRNGLIPERCSVCGADFKSARPGGEPKTISATVARQPFSDLVIEGYRIEGILGVGGMGSVISARQISLDRPVAVKVLAPELASDAAVVERFQREAQTMAQLVHPNIVTIYERGRCEPYYYYIMEYVEGPQGWPIDLRRRMARRDFDAAQVRAWGLQIAAALDHAHRRGVIHRDVKPGNVMLDRHGVAKVTDFGVAMLRAGDEHMLTSQSSALGTPLYMAPEQRDDPAGADGRADIYSTAVTLYELLTGKLPIGLYEPPSQLVPGLDAAWDGLFARALQNTPDRRYADMTEFSTALASLDRFPEVSQADRPTVRPPSSVTRLKAAWPACPRCAAVHPPDATRCGGCGADLASLRELLSSAKRKLAVAMNEPGRERHLRLEEAVVEFDAALNAIPHDAALEELLAESRRLLVAALVEEGEREFAADRPAAAEKHYKRAAEIDSECAAAREGLKKVFVERERALHEAERLRRSGHIERAIELLAETERRFPDDREICEKHFACRDRLARVRRLVREKLPALEKERRFHGILETLDEIARHDVPIKGLDDCRSRIAVKLRKAAVGVARARGLIETLAFARARTLLESVLADVADDREARELLAEIDSRQDEIQGEVKGLDDALRTRRWFVAARLAGAVDRVQAGKTEGREPDPRNGEWVRIDRGLLAAERYFAGVACTFAGLFLWLVGVGLAAWAGRELAPALAEATGAPPVVAADAAAVAALLLFAGLAHGLLATVLAKSLRLPAVLAAGVVTAILAGLVRWGVCWLDAGLRSRSLFEIGEDVSIAPRLVAAVALGFLLASFVAGATVRSLRALDRNAGFRPLGAGSLAAAIAALALTWPYPPIGSLLLAPVAIGLCAAVGWNRTIRRHSILFVAAIASGVLAFGLEHSGLAGGAAAILLQLACWGAAFYFCRDSESEMAERIAAGAACFLMVAAAAAAPPALYPIAWAAAGLFLQSAGVALAALGDEVDDRSHFADRFPAANAPTLA